jgi:hypothetical protein
MGELNTKLNEEFFKELENGSVLITFSQEEREKCRKNYSEFSEKENKIDKLVRRERSRADAGPNVYLTF